MGNYALMVAASAVGLWLSFAMRKPTLAFDDLLHPEGDMGAPGQRTLLVVLFSLILALVCGYNMAGVSIGKFSTEHL